MKTVLTLIWIALLLPVAYAQKGFTLGANFMPMNSNIVVQNTWGNGHEYEYDVTFNTSNGLDAGYNFSDHIGINTGYWFMDLGQNYKDSYDGSDWERSVKLKYHMIPVIMKFNGTKSKVNFLGAAGVLLASLKEADQEWTRDGNIYNEIIENPITGEDFELGAADVTHRYNKSDIILSLEVGARFLFSEKLYLDATLDFGHGLKDINAPDWQIPDGDGVYDPSHNAYGGLKVGIAYVLFGGE